MDDTNLIDEKEKTVQGQCTGNCIYKVEMFMSICITCGTDDWGGDGTDKYEQ